MIRRFLEYEANGKEIWHSSFASRASSDARSSSYLIFCSEIIIDDDLMKKRNCRFEKNGMRLEQEYCVMECGEVPKVWGAVKHSIA